MKDKYVVEEFLKNFSPMFELMLKEFEESTSIAILTELCYVFCILLFNEKNALMTNKGQIIYSRILQIQNGGELSKETQKYVDNMIELLKKWFYDQNRFIPLYWYYSFFNVLCFYDEEIG